MDNFDVEEFVADHLGAQVGINTWLCALKTQGIFLGGKLGRNFCPQWGGEIWGFKCLLVQHWVKDEHDDRDLDNDVAEVNHHNFDDSDDPSIMTKVAMAMVAAKENYGRMPGWRSCGWVSLN